MPMKTLTLRQARCAFSLAIAQLLLYAHTLGYEVALAEGMDRRTEKDPTSDHMTGSLHDIGLAQDLDLYLKGVYLMATEDHSPLGMWWEEYGVEQGLPLVWGGNFSSQDGNHYALRFNGKS